MMKEKKGVAIKGVELGKGRNSGVDKNGNAWTKYTITDQDGDKYTDFNTTYQPGMIVDLVFNEEEDSFTNDKGKLINYKKRTIMMGKGSKVPANAPKMPQEETLYQKTEDDQFEQIMDKLDKIYANLDDVEERVIQMEIRIEDIMIELKRTNDE